MNTTSSTTYLVGAICLVIGLAVGFLAQNLFGSANYMHTSIPHTMSMTDMMHSMNAALEGKKGNDFDKAFISEMIVHHQGAVQMAELALKSSERKEIRELSQAIITAQNKEIADMQNWQRSWFGN